jgi:hypothetical protein
LDEGRFANGQNGRDLRVGSHARELETQLMEVIDSTGDFFRFVEIFNARDGKQSKEVFRRWKQALRNKRTQESSSSTLV